MHYIIIIFSFENNNGLMISATTKCNRYMHRDNIEKMMMMFFLFIHWHDWPYNDNDDDYVMCISPTLYMTITMIFNKQSNQMMPVIMSCLYMMYLWFYQCYLQTPNTHTFYIIIIIVESWNESFFCCLAPPKMKSFSGGEKDRPIFFFFRLYSDKQQQQRIFFTIEFSINLVWFFFANNIHNDNDNDDYHCQDMQNLNSVFFSLLLMVKLVEKKNWSNRKSFYSFETYTKSIYGSFSQSSSFIMIVEFAVFKNDQPSMVFMSQVSFIEIMMMMTIHQMNSEQSFFHVTFFHLNIWAINFLNNNITLFFYFWWFPWF